MFFPICALWVSCAAIPAPFVCATIEICSVNRFHLATDRRRVDRQHLSLSIESAERQFSSAAALFLGQNDQLPVQSCTVCWAVWNASAVSAIVKSEKWIFRPGQSMRLGRPSMCRRLSAINKCFPQIFPTPQPPFPKKLCWRGPSGNEKISF